MCSLFDVWRGTPNAQIYLKQTVSFYPYVTARLRAPVVGHIKKLLYLGNNL